MMLLINLIVPKVQTEWSTSMAFSISIEIIFPSQPKIILRHVLYRNFSLARSMSIYFRHSIEDSGQLLKALFI